jgi:hypothetical protein
MKNNRTNLQAALLGAAIVAIPFGLWSYLLAFQFCVECDASISFGVVLPAVILGCPWSLIWLVVLMQLQMVFGIDVSQAVMLTGYVVCVAINGALLGLFRHKKRRKNAR